MAIHFDTLGGLAEPGDNACNKPEDVSVDVATVYGRGWQTALGLGIGDTFERMKSLYPRAAYSSRPYGTRGDFWILNASGPECSICDPTRLVARFRMNRVSGFLLPVHGQGE